MPNPDSGNLPSDLANKPPTFKRKARGGTPAVTEKTANWPGLPGKTGPNRSAGVKKVKSSPKSEGI